MGVRQQFYVYVARKLFNWLFKEQLSMRKFVVFDSYRIADNLIKFDGRLRSI